MRWLEQLRMRILMLFSRDRAADTLDEELRFHLERQIDENLAAGMSAGRSTLCGTSHLWQSCAAARTIPRHLELELA